MQVEFFSIRIFSDNYISQKMFEKMGAVKIGEEGRAYPELMRRLMLEMGRENFEKIIKEEFEKTQRYIIRYRLAR